MNTYAPAIDGVLRIAARVELEHFGQVNSEKIPDRPQKRKKEK